MARYVLERTTRVPAPVGEVFAFFSDPRNLAQLTPPEMGFRIERIPEHSLRAGDRIEYAIRLFGVRLRWTTLIATWNENESFSDLQERGPYSYWLHTHTFRAAGGETEMHDRVEYELPFGMAGRLFGLPLVRRELRRIFDYRAEQIARHFAK